MPHDHTAAPWFAALYDAFMGPVERHLLGRLRSRLLAGLSGDVLEIGAGTGANFPLLSGRGEALRLTAAEPDPRMAAQARRRAEASGLEVRFVEAPAEALPFPDASFDVVVATLVFCTVEDPERALSEVRRVLRPGGELRFLEHVRSEGWQGTLQDWLRPAWSVIGAGCQLNRRTGEAIALSGFTPVERERLPAPLPIARLELGVAHKRPVV